MCRGQEGKVRKKLVVQTSQNNDSYFFALSKCPKKDSLRAGGGKAHTSCFVCINWRHETQMATPFRSGSLFIWKRQIFDSSNPAWLFVRLKT